MDRLKLSEIMGYSTCNLAISSFIKPFISLLICTFGRVALGKVDGFMLRSGMKQLTVLVILILGSVCAQAQTDQGDLRKAIAYYQQLKFDESLAIFDKLVIENDTDMSLIERRGFVCCQYIKAMEENMVSKVENDRYAQIIAIGISDLEKSMKSGMISTDSQACLEYLKKRKR